MIKSTETLIRHVAESIRPSANSEHMRSLQKYAKQLGKHDVRPPKHGEDMMVYFCTLTVEER